MTSTRACSNPTPSQPKKNDNPNEGVDLDELNAKLDKALESETKESLEEWIDKQTNDNMEEKELNLKEIVDSNFYCGYKYCCRNGEGNLAPLKCDNVLCVARVMKPKRWRAECGDTYYCLRDDFSVCSQYENEDELCDHEWERYNYFRTEELAQQAAEAVRKCLEDFHESLTLIHGYSQSSAERRTV